MPILMQYACFACRKVFKKPMPQTPPIDYPCPNCTQPLTMMGTAFRAPRRADQSQWSKVEQLARAGVLFYRNSGPRPKTLNEVPAFLKAKAKENLLPGRIAQSTTLASRYREGRLKRQNVEGNPVFTLAGRELRPWMRVLVREGNNWLKGTFRSTGDGGKAVEPHVAVGSKKVFICVQTMLRWPG